MDAETYKLAYEIHSHRGLASHEAGHAAAGLVQDLRVVSVEAPLWRLEDVAAGNPDDPAGVAWIEHPTDDEGRRKMAIAIMAGQLEDGHAPPRWPLSLAPMTPDEADVCRLVQQLDLDAKGYSALVDDAFTLTTSQPYMRLHAVISELLERQGSLDETALRRIKAIAVEEAEMEHLTKAATVTAADQGEFTAIAAAYTVDRQNDQIIRGAFANTINRWRASGKNLPATGTTTAPPPTSSATSTQRSCARPTRAYRSVASSTSTTAPQPGKHGGQ